MHAFRFLNKSYSISQLGHVLDCIYCKLKKIAQARLRLSPNDQLLLGLFYDESRSYEEIAAMLEISINAVGPKLDRARRRLKSVLERPPDG